MGCVVVANRDTKLVVEVCAPQALSLNKPGYLRYGQQVDVLFPLRSDQEHFVVSFRAYYKGGAVCEQP